MTMPRWIKTLVSGSPNRMCTCWLGSDIISESALFTSRQPTAWMEIYIGNSAFKNLVRVKIIFRNNYNK